MSGAVYGGGAGVSGDDVVARVVANDLCSGCGVCAGVCPSRLLRMRWSPLGELQPVREGGCPPSCGVCLEVCPFSGAGASPGAVARAAFGAQPGVRWRDDVGAYLSCRAGHSAVGTQRRRGSSGGMATWILSSLLEQRLVDRVACVVPAEGGHADRLFRFALLDTPAAVAAAAGSRYHPVEVSAALRDLLDGDERTAAIVGLPCLVHAVNLARERLPKLRRRVPFTVALACGRLPGRFYTEYLARASGLAPQEVRGVDYRVKEGAPDAGDFGFQAITVGGCSGRRLPFSGAPGEAWKRWYFMHRSCLFCEDQYGETADAVCMDAWLPGYVDDTGGTSLVISRSDVVEKLVTDGCSSGSCLLQPVDISEVARSQQGGLFHKRVLIRGHLHRAAARGEWVPPRRARPSRALYLRHRRRIELAAGALPASKEAWARHRDDPTVEGFLRVMRPWERRAVALDRSERIGRRVSRFVSDPVGAVSRRLRPPSPAQPSFLLAGVDGTFNYGGEGIVRGTFAILRGRWPVCRVVVASAHPAADAGRLADLGGLEVVPAKRRWTPRRVVLGIGRRLGFGSGSRLPLRPSLATACDALLSIGGDNYCCMDGAGRIHTGTFELMALAERARRRGRAAVLWGASVGPFDADPVLRERFARHLRGLSLITVREPASAEYLGLLGLGDRVVAAADPAFLLQPQDAEGPVEKGAGRLLVGVNLSPASLNHCCAGDPAGIARLRESCLGGLRLLLEDPAVDLLLVPHVVEPGVPENDDHAFLEGLRRDLGAGVVRVRLLPRDLGARRTKGELARLDAVVAARMHCAVAAASSGVPTLFLQYSAKAGGMARYVYGDDAWCLALPGMTPHDLRDSVRALLARRDELRRVLTASRARWEREARAAGEALAQVLAR